MSSMTRKAEVKHTLLFSIMIFDNLNNTDTTSGKIIAASTRPIMPATARDLKELRLLARLNIVKIKMPKKAVCAFHFIACPFSLLSDRKVPREV
jgi:hypothetical protein